MDNIRDDFFSVRNGYNTLSQLKVTKISSRFLYVQKISKPLSCQKLSKQKYYKDQCKKSRKTSKAFRA